MINGSRCPLYNRHIGVCDLKYSHALNVYKELHSSTIAVIQGSLFFHAQIHKISSSSITSLSSVKQESFCLLQHKHRIQILRSILNILRQIKDCIILILFNTEYGKNYEAAFARISSEKS